MIGWVARSAMRSAKLPSVPRSQTTPRNNIPGAVCGAIVVISLFAIFVVMAAGPSAGVMIVCALLFSALIFGGWIYGGVTEQHKAAANIRDLDYQQHATTSADLRRQANIAERDRRVQDILSARCPLCGTQNSTCLTTAPADPAYVLDRSRGLWAHGARIGAAVKNGYASRAEVTAQFKGIIPDDVRRHM